jgi:hypothetical protein
MFLMMVHAILKLYCDALLGNGWNLRYRYTIRDEQP